MSAEAELTTSRATIERLSSEPAHALLRGDVARMLHNEWGWPDGDPLAWSEAWLDARLSHAEERVFAAVRNGVAVGAASLRVTDELPGYDDVTPWLSSLIVATPARNVGIGSALVEMVCAEARARGAEEIFLYTRLSGFYLTRGFRRVDTIRRRGASQAVMRRSLLADPNA